MDDFTASLSKKPVTVFYRVSESIIGFDAYPDKVKSFFYDEDFKGQDLLSIGEKAIEYYGNRWIQFKFEGINKTFFGKSFSNPDDFIPGENYAYSNNLDIVFVDLLTIIDFRLNICTFKLYEKNHVKKMIKFY